MIFRAETVQKLTLLPLRKSVSTTRAAEVKKAGIIHLGENRAEVLLDKQETITEDVVWHFIGNVQSRKVRELVGQIDYLHSLDRMSIAKEIQKRATENN